MHRAHTSGRHWRPCLPQKATARLSACREIWWSVDGCAGVVQDDWIETYRWGSSKMCLQEEGTASRSHCRCFMGAEGLQAVDECRAKAAFLDVPDLKGGGWSVSSPLSTFRTSPHLLTTSKITSRIATRRSSHEISLMVAPPTTVGFPPSR